MLGSDRRFAADELAGYQQQLDDALLAAADGGSLRGRVAMRPGPPVHHRIQKFGTDLFEALIKDEVRRIYDGSLEHATRDGKGLRIKLRVLPARLTVLPWEYMYDARGSGEYISRSRRTPLVRYIESEQATSPWPYKPPLRILGVAANPEDRERLGSSEERFWAESAMRKLTDDQRVHFHWPPAQSWRDIYTALRRDEWHVLHFIGHGAFDATHSNGVLVLTDENGRSENATAERLWQVIADTPSLRLVLLNSCKSGRGDGQSALSSVAAALVNHGVASVVAMQNNISDRAAIEFSRTFYEVIAEESPVDVAVAAARRAMGIELDGTLEFGTPVVFMRSGDGRVFSIAATANGRSSSVVAEPEAPSTDDGRWRAAVSCLYTRNWGAAVEALTEILAEDPENQAARAKLEVAIKCANLSALYEDATRAIEAEDWDRAVERLQQVVQVEPTFPQMEPGAGPDARVIEPIDAEQAQYLLTHALARQKLTRLYRHASDLHRTGQWRPALDVLAEIHHADPGFPDSDELEASARDQLRRTQRARDHAALYSAGVAYIDDQDWANAVQTFGKLHHEAPGYGDSAVLLNRARNELYHQLEADVVPHIPRPFRALLYCLLYELQPDRYAEYLPKLVNAVEDPANALPAETIFANIAGIVGFTALAQHLSGVDEQTRERLVRLIAPVVYVAQSSGAGSPSPALLDQLLGEPTDTSAFLVGDDQMASDDQPYVIGYSTDPSVISDLSRRAAMVLQDPADLSEFVFKAQDDA